MKKNKNKLEKILAVLVFAVIAVIGSYFGLEDEGQVDTLETDNLVSYELSNIPEYSGKIYIEINNNIPNFTSEDLNIKSDYYSTLNNGKVRNGND